MRFPINWKDEAAIQRAFTYATRTGIGRRMPMPLGWYQLHQVAALNELERCARAATGAPPGVEVPVTVHLRKGHFYARSVDGPEYPCAVPFHIFLFADRKART